MKCRLGLTRLRAFGGISKGMPDKVEVGIMGRVVCLLVGMAVAVAVALHPAEMAGMLVLLAGGTAGVVALVVGTVALPLVEMKEAGEEGAHLREPRGTPQSLDGRTLQQGRTEPLLAQVLDEILTVMTVCLIQMMDLSFRPPILCSPSASIRTLGCCFSASSRRRSTAWSHPLPPTTTATTCSAGGTTTSACSWP